VTCQESSRRNSGPDGRVLSTIGPDSDGEPLLTWLAIGYRDIYQ
jgi:hypothetical protein